jgi:flagellar hook protein FlgE
MSFAQGLSGLNAASSQLDAIGNNVANASTVGFKSSDAVFADVYANAVGASASTSIGIGTSVAEVRGDFGQGNVTATNNPLDVAINGSGFYRLDTNGVITYSRNGQFNVDKDGTLVNAAGADVTGYGVDATGKLITANPGPINISTSDLIPTPTSTALTVLNLDSRDPVATAPFSLTNPATYNSSTSMTIYDSLGNPHTYSTYYAKTASNAWGVYGSVDGGPAASIGTLNFKSDGTLDTAASPMPISITTALTTGATTPLTFALDYTGSTQFGSVFGTTTLNQNGFTSGKLAGFNVSSDGTVVGNYSNGQTRTLGQVVLANFANVQGLQPLGGNAYEETNASGQAVIGTPGSGSLGALQSGAVEESNVDLTNELVNMITAQRFYQANAQTIKTEDQVMNTLVNLQ